MICRTLEPYIIDLARDVTVDAMHDAELTRHLAACPQCAATLERERAMSVALRRLAQSTPGAMVNRLAEQALLARVYEALARDDSHRPRHERGHVGWSTWSRAAAATVVFGVLLTGLVARTVWRRESPPVTTPMGVTGAAPGPAASPTSVAAPTPTPASTIASTIAELPSASRPEPGIWDQQSDPPPAREFVLWPGAAAWPPFESGELVQIDLPVSMLTSLGLSPPSMDVEVVRADVLVAQDGFARAVRLAQ